MYKKLCFVLIIFLLLFGCGQPTASGNLKKVGLLVPETIDDQVWGTNGYKGLLKIQTQFNVDVFYKEGISNEVTIRDAIEEFQQQDVNLIFGHGNEYTSFFNHIATDYPDIHFVVFNGDVEGDNVTSLNFESHAMGFFGGMVAGEMTKSEKVGILAAFEWQPEVDGFFEGAYYENEAVHVDIKYVQDWNNADAALPMLEEMLAEGVDVVYVAGDGYNVSVIERLKEAGLFAIGFVSDQSDLGKATVLTSTVQHIDVLYELVAERFNNGELESGELYFDFKDDAITMGEYSPLVDEDYIKTLNKHIEQYKTTGKLPNQ
ncbi:BMP family ABC transporter substrate-binding protein [Metabacillus malikii]|uniref:Transcriptional activator of comK protein n=1 Tax=Metabacillus malikii TaxID=1504265 RepID=A0ABT9ZK82_9BACI|nr:BMP family ABC transporter substrate-binding protein [Metabacillus malikii]MDQ0232294.1 transcriptional activator of comK gene [Metabacillus malikii]